MTKTKIVQKNGDNENQINNLDLTQTSHSNTKAVLIVKKKKNTKAVLYINLICNEQ
jgi:hypothetical protein